MIKYKKFVQKYSEGERIIYTTEILGATYRTDSLKKLKEFIKNNKETFKTLHDEK